MRVHGVILAAGRGTRMGGRIPKLLLPVPTSGGGVPLVRETVRNALESRLDRVFVVVGYREADLRAALEPLGPTERLTVVHNPLWAEGRSSSIRLGVERAVEAGAEAVCLLCGDQPRISAPVIDRVLGALGASGAPFSVAVRSDGTAGRPLVLRAAILQQILGAAPGDSGVHSFVEQRWEEGSRVPLDEEETRAQRGVDDAADYSAIVAEISAALAVPAETSPAPESWEPPPEEQEWVEEPEGAGEDKGTAPPPDEEGTGPGRRRGGASPIPLPKPKDRAR